MEIINLRSRNEPDICAGLKQILDLYDFKIRAETYNKNIILNKIFFKDYVEISTIVTVWNKNTENNYKKYTAKITIANNEIKNYTKKRLKFLLLSDIFKQIIKNNIMMI